MTTEAEPRTSAAIGGMGHSVKRKEDPRFIRGKGEYIDDVNLPGQLWLDIVRSPYAHAKIKSIDTLGGPEGPGRRRGRHRQGPGGLQAPLDADAGRRHADGAPRGHRHVPVAGGRGGHRHVPLRRRRRRRGRARRLRAAAGHRRPAQGARVGRVRPAPGPRPGQADQPHLALGIGRPGRRGCRARGRRRDRVGGHLHPAHPRRLDRDVRLRRGLGPGPPAAHPAHDQPGAARHPDGPRARRRRAPACPSTSTTSGSRRTTSAAASGARCRSIRATSWPSRPRSSPASRSSGSRIGPRTCRPTRSPATTTSTPSWARPRKARSPA